MPDGKFSFVIPKDLPVGDYSILITTTDGQTIERIGALTVSGVASSACGEGSKVWTKRISETQAKVYMKCPAIGDSYSFSVQEGGSGAYDTRLTRTLQSEDSDEQLFNENGRYIVRTVELGEITRIRISINGETVWQVRYNAGSFGG